MIGKIALFFKLGHFQFGNTLCSGQHRPQMIDHALYTGNLLGRNQHGLALRFRLDPAPSLTNILGDDDIGGVMAGPALALQRCEDIVAYGPVIGVGRPWAPSWR